MPSDEEWIEAGMTADESLGKPARRSAEQGIRDMEAQITLLKERLQKVASRLSQMGSTEYEIKTLTAERSKLTEELATAHDRLAEYKTQLEGRN